MAKVTLPNISSGFASTTQLNTALDTIEAEFNNKVLYRDPPAGEDNQLEADIDANDHTLYNVRDAVNVDEVVPLRQVQAILSLLSSGATVEVRETFTATADQQLFTLSGVTYALNANALSVYYNGIRQRKTVNYSETSTSSFTFVDQLNEGDIVEAVVMVA